MHFLSHFAHWDVVALLIALTIVLVLEMLGVFGAHYVTITALARQYLPAWLRAMIIGWMAYHFLIAKG